MSYLRTTATAKRVLHQLRHDHRTIALLLVVPPLLLTLLKYVFNNQPRVFEQLAPTLLGVFPMVMMFLITSIVTLRERTSGTLDRLMTMPISKLDYLLGYAAAFSLVACVQAVVTSWVMLTFLGVVVQGGTGATIVAALAAALLGTSLGLFVSAFARTEFQAIQFMPAFIFPQLLTCGLFSAREAMAEPLQWFANGMPLTYSVDAMKEVTQYAEWTGRLTGDLLVVGIFVMAALVLGAVTIRRQSKA